MNICQIYSEHVVTKQRHLIHHSSFINISSPNNNTNTALDDLFAKISGEIMNIFHQIDLNSNLFLMICLKFMEIVYKIA